MSRRFERHRRSKMDWDPLPPRSVEVRVAADMDPEPPKRAPAKKDTRSWCRGKAGVAHDPVLVLDTSSPHFREGECRWGALWVTGLRERRAGWMCGHREVCARCGRVLRDRPLPQAECPTYPGSPRQRARVERELAEREAWLAEVAARRRQHRPTVAGPQGYRRKREA